MSLPSRPMGGLPSCSWMWSCFLSGGFLWKLLLQERKEEVESHNYWVQSSSELWLAAIFRRCTFRLVLTVARWNSDGEDDFQNGKILDKDNSRFFLFWVCTAKRGYEMRVYHCGYGSLPPSILLGLFCSFCRPRARVCVCAWFSFSYAKLS